MILSEEICEEILQDYQIFDIRTKEEWKETGVIKDAVLLCLTDSKGDIDSKFLSKFKALADTSKEIALVCKSGKRSAHAAHLIKRELGLLTTNLKGGMLSLLEQGYKSTPYKE